MSLRKVPRLGLNHHETLVNIPASTQQKEGSERFTSTVKEHVLAWDETSNEKELKRMNRSFHPKHKTFANNLTWKCFNPKTFYVSTPRAVGSTNEKVNGVNTPMKRKWKRKAH